MCMELHRNTGVRCLLHGEASQEPEGGVAGRGAMLHRECVAMLGVRAWRQCDCRGRTVPEFDDSSVEAAHVRSCQQPHRVGHSRVSPGGQRGPGVQACSISGMSHYRGPLKPGARKVRRRAARSSRPARRLGNNHQGHGRASGIPPLRYVAICECTSSPRVCSLAMQFDATLN